MKLLYPHPNANAAPPEPGSLPEVYVGKRGVYVRGGFQAIVEQGYETNSRLARIEALLERIALAAERS
jgi:hypothetical protein